MSIVEVGVTARVIAVAWVCGFAVGVPAVILGASALKLKVDSWTAWALAPLVGCGAIILFCQNLLYLDIPVARSTVVVWSLAAIGWLVVLLSPHRRAALRPVPLVALAAGSLVYLIHGAGLLRLGASYYYGYGWDDMFNYVAQAELFAHWPFSSSDTTPNFLRAAHFYKLDRIGQSVLHAFLVASSGADAQQTFGATILLAPFLIFFALLAMARRFVASMNVSVLAAAAGALAPAVATVHLECFFSQAMSMPFLVLWPLAVGRLVENPGWRQAIPAGLLLAVIAAIYTELVPILLGIALVCALARETEKLWAGRMGWHVGSADPVRAGRVTFWLLFALLVAFLANLGFRHSAVAIMSRTTSGDVLGMIYPWAYRPEGMARLWVGNQVGKPLGMALAAVASLVLIGVALTSLGLRLHRRFSYFLLVLALLMLIPVGPLALGKASSHSYQFYKLVLSVAPLYVFWLIIASGERLRANPGRLPAYAFGALFAAVNAALVFSIASASANPETVAKSHRGAANLLIDPDFHRVRELLGATSGRDVYLLWVDSEMYSGSYRTAWLEYFARNNRVIPMIATISVHNDPAGVAFSKRLSQIETRPAAPPLVVSWKQHPGLENRKLYANSRVFIYQPASAAELNSMIEDTRIEINRKLDLEVADETAPDHWYPVWVSGQPGNASLLTVQFGESNTFRYDQWGYPPVKMVPGGECRGNRIKLELRMSLFDRNIRLVCNGAVTEAALPLAATSLQLSGPVRFGESPLISSLEGKYPLDEAFPGRITEVP